MSICDLRSKIKNRKSLILVLRSKDIDFGLSGLRSMQDCKIDFNLFNVFDRKKAILIM